MCSLFFSKCASCFSCYKSEQLKQYVELEEYQKIESEPESLPIIGRPEFRHVPADKIPYHGKGFTGTLRQATYASPRVETDYTEDMQSVSLTENTAMKPTARKYGSTQAVPLHIGSYSGIPSAQLQLADFPRRSGSDSEGSILGGKGQQLRTSVENEPELEEGVLIEDTWSHHGSSTSTAVGSLHRASSFAATDYSTLSPPSRRANTGTDKLNKQERVMQIVDGHEECRLMIERSLSFPPEVKYSTLSFSPSLDLQKLQAVTPPTSRPESPASWAASDEDDDSQPTLQFSLYYDIQRRTLTVNLQQAYNLPVKDIFMGSSDPFIVMFLLPSREEILQSKIVEKDLNPVFDQEFEFRAILSQELYSQVLVMQVYDHKELASNDLIGSVLIPMKEAELHGMTMKRKIGEGKNVMKQFSTSDLLESLRYSDNQKQIQASSLAGIGARAISTSCSSDHSSQESCDSPDVQSSDPERGTRMKTSGVSDESILQFSLYYERHQCSLIVHLCRAFNVPTQCKSEASNCFVTLYLLPKKKKIFQSHVIPGTHHPKFDQVFEFAKLAAGEVHQQSLVFCIHNSHGGKDDFVGQALLSLKSSNFDGESIKLSIAEVQLDEQAKDAYGGELLLSLAYWPDMGILEGVIMEAVNLRKADVFGLSDPYVKVCLLHSGERCEKWKTSIKKHTLAPVFHEKFQLNVSNMQIADVSLQLVLMDFDRFIRNKRIGTIEIGDHSPQKSGQTHWRQTCLSPHQTVSSWHSIQLVGHTCADLSDIDHP